MHVTPGQRVSPSRVENQLVRRSDETRGDNLVWIASLQGRNAGAVAGYRSPAADVSRCRGVPRMPPCHAHPDAQSGQCVQPRVPGWRPNRLRIHGVNVNPRVSSLADWSPASENAASRSGSGNRVLIEMRFAFLIVPARLPRGCAITLRNTCNNDECVIRGAYCYPHRGVSLNDSVTRGERAYRKCAITSFWPERTDRAGDSRAGSSPVRPTSGKGLASSAVRSEEGSPPRR